MSLRCLVVDDSPHFLEVARDLLEREGVAVVAVAQTSADALHRAAELDPDVVLVDIDLGEESGFDLTQKLTAVRNGQRRVILISAYSEMDFADMIATSSATAFLPKSDLSGRAIRDLLTPPSTASDHAE
ncbi:response regulator [Streptomyces sp. KR80]|uniref:response regulator n=1 Tax=Streptomyces sp. KR80 TaxID=3457426 RepID=UPI003FD02003